MQNPNFRTSPAKKPKLTKSGAETIAIEVLAFLAKDPARLECFLAQSGAGLDNLRAAAEPGFLAAVLEHLASDEGLLLTFAAQAKQNPEEIAKARELLSPPSETP
jgi:hypothetical protein